MLRSWSTPRERDLRLIHLVNQAGLDISVAPNGSVFAIAHRSDKEAILVNQVRASPVGGGIARIVLRLRAKGSSTHEVLGPKARVRLGATRDRIVWEGTTRGIRHRVTLCLVPGKTAWLWHVEATNAAALPVSIDAIFVQDLGLGASAFVTGNEAYASQYIDHHVAMDTHYGPVVMSRQNLAQAGAHPWVMHGCLEGSDGFTTDAMQLFGPSYRDADGLRLPFGTRLASRRLQHEVATIAIQSLPNTVQPGASRAWRFFALYEPDHPDASNDGDLKKLRGMSWPRSDAIGIATVDTRRSIAQDGSVARVVGIDDVALAKRYPERFLEEFRRGRLLSFFAPDPPHNRHVVLHAKERLVTRRHGALLRSGRAMLPDASTLCV
ncbi:MAG TPA: cellobiose phosphorylase, partial [Casimicrobiaceae bacterium]|nr:cellobiose phosphorylase [Casimicrobiaceae bacterium]